MSPAVSITYELHPPGGTIAGPSLQTKKSHDFPLKASSNLDQQEYYKSLRDAVLSGKALVGSELTEWRDAVGTSENSKEPKKGKKSDDEDGEEDDDEE